MNIIRLCALSNSIWFFILSAFVAYSKVELWNISYFILSYIFCILGCISLIYYEYLLEKDIRSNYESKM